MVTVDWVLKTHHLSIILYCSPPPHFQTARVGWPWSSNRESLLWPTWVGLALSDPGDGDAATLGVTEAEQEGAVLPLVQALLGLDLADEANDGAGNIIMT